MRTLLFPAIVVVGSLLGCRGGIAEDPDLLAPPWAEVIAAVPDPRVIEDPAIRAELIATGRAWWVRDRATGIELRLVPPGSFERGSETPPAHPEEGPVHEARVEAPFYLGVTEVTQAQWRAVMGDHPFEFPGENHPAENISVPAIEKFLERTSFELPTEVEWEWVAWRADQSRSPDRAAESWSQRDEVLGPQPVATRRANALGFFDLFGNVWELTRGDWTPHFSSAAERAPVTAADERRRWRGRYYQSFRGGGWVSAEDDLRVSRRQRYSPGSGFYDTGFRVWRSAQAEPSSQARPRGESR